eukprot:1156529-Pelagomonas_calceolata.AAC.1
MQGATSSSSVRAQRAVVSVCRGSMNAESSTRNGMACMQGARSSSSSSSVQAQRAAVSVCRESVPEDACT